MRKNSVLLRSAASSAIILGALAATLPANASSLPSSTASTHGSSSVGSLSPASVGSIVCSDDLCIQRITSIVNGTASVKAWADTSNIPDGTFYISGGPEGYYGASGTQTWIAGGAGYVFTDVPMGGGYTADAWSDGLEISDFMFKV